MRKKPHPETCERCPNRYGKTGCPCWVGPEAGLIETNTATGEERVVTGCFYQIMPRLFTHVIAASNRPAAAVESTRNELAEQLQRGFGVLGQALQSLPQLTEERD